MAVALVTGSSTGIGYATALRLARDGYDVVATMRNPTGCDLAAKAEAEGLRVGTRALDVDDSDFVAAVIGGVLEERGAIDVLVNNAGVGGGSGAIEEAPLDATRAAMETNFFGALRCTKAVLPSMRERGRGCIVNVTSQAGRIALPGMGSYCASKWALEAASEVLSLEVEPFGIRVAVIEPGAIMTPIWTKVDRTPPTGPYAAVRNRLAAVVLTDIMQASTAEEVADCISTAIATDQPRLRWLVGQGAERNIRVAAETTPEERARLWNSPDDAEFMRRMMPD